jgi:hypothetical protein
MPFYDPETDASELMLSQTVAEPGDSIVRRRAQIDQRKQALKQAMANQMQMPSGEGRMVGGRWIPPSFGDYLAPAVQRFLNAYEGGKLTKEGAQLTEAEQARARELYSAMGEGQRAVPLGSRDAPQPPEVTPAPTGKDRRAIIAGLMELPAERVMGQKLMQDELLDAPRRAEALAGKREDREDRQVEARAALEANQQLRREQLAQQAEQAKQASEDRRLSIEQRREAAQMHAQLMAQLSADRLAAKANAPEKPAKPLPNAVHKELASLEDTAANMTQLASTFKPEYAGPKAAIAVAAAPYFPEALVPGKAPDATAEWWKNYKKQSELVERHALFGASLTANEQASWKSADISPGMGEKTIKTNLDKRKSIADKMFANAVDRYEKGGHANVREAFNPAAIRSTGGAEGSWGGAPTVVRTGTRNGKRVEQLSDGSIRDAK